MINIRQPHFSFIAIVLTASIFSFSCTNINSKKVAGKTIEPGTTRVQINWIGHWLNEGDKENLVREVANEYEFLNQDVKVNLKFPEEVYGGGGEPDVAFIISQIEKPTSDWDIVRLFGYFPEIAKKLNDPEWTDKYLVDFGKVPGFLESHKEFMNNKIYKNRFNNKFFGPYNEGQIAALFVNLEVAKKMGITVKQFDMTFEDFLSYIKAAFEYNKTHQYVTPFFDYDWFKSNTLFNILFYSLMQNSDQLFDTKLTSQKLDAIEKCYQALEELSKYKPLEKNWRKRKWSNENDFILKDSCLFFPNFTFMYGIWKKKDKEKMNKVIPCEFPVFKTSVAYCGGFNANWAVLKNSPHKDDAIKLLMYWCRPEIAEKWVRYSKSPSGVKGNFTTSSFGTDPYESYSYTIEKKYGSNLSKDEDNQYIVGEKNKNIDLLIQDVMEGRISAKEAMDEFRKKAVY